jgi:hypothetical protein
MNPKYYHTPPQPISTRLRCPVCHETVYSRAGIHPQCAVRQSDPPRLKSKAPKLPPPTLTEPVPISLPPDHDQAGVEVVPERPGAFRVFDPDRTPV